MKFFSFSFFFLLINRRLEPRSVPRKISKSLHLRKALETEAQPKEIVTQLTAFEFYNFSLHYFNE